jgi:hypothetical protein
MPAFAITGTALGCSLTDGVLGATPCRRSGTSTDRGRRWSEGGPLNGQAASRQMALSRRQSTAQRMTSERNARPRTVRCLRLLWRHSDRPDLNAVGSRSGLADSPGVECPAATIRAIAFISDHFAPHDRVGDNAITGSGAAHGGRRLGIAAILHAVTPALVSARGPRSPTLGFARRYRSGPPQNCR